MAKVLEMVTLGQMNILADEKDRPPAYPQQNLIFPARQYKDDFLDTMRKVFLWSRLFGVVGAANALWKLWGFLLVGLMVAVCVGSFYKLIKLLAGLTAYSAGNRSFAARLAGAMFYSTSTMSLILSWKLASDWHKITVVWASVERRSSMIIPQDTRLKRRMVVMATLMAIIATFEHIVSVISSIEMDCPPNEILEKYILQSHAFILISSDYSITLALAILLISNMATLLWSFQDLLIVLVSMGLTSRYHRLNQCVAKLCLANAKDTKWNKNTELLKVMTWRKIRDAYVKQAALVKTIDNALGGLILLSSFGNYYFICLQIFLGITQGIPSDIIKRLYFMISLIWLCMRFSFVVLAASDVHVHSQRALRDLHACNTKFYNVEIERLQKQLTKDYVALTGMGFFSLDRTILLKMAGVIITYELVLIQFDNKDFSFEPPLLNETSTTKQY